ncbi:MAG: DUF3795 domain-containing protein [Dehalococcoidales bacterium]|nr:DUF3795 domain-containing protein [Dehalococcoidales bacterium]
MSEIDSRCGLVCADCDYRERTGCGCCIATNGHPFYGECRLAACCQEKGHLHCGLCPDFPCTLLREFSTDPEHGDDPQWTRIDQCRVWAG